MDLMATKTAIEEFDPLGTLARWSLRFLQKYSRWVMGVIIAFTVFLGILAIAGRLGAFYAWLYRRTPGRQWTYAMRDYPWLYAIGAIVILVILLLTFERERYWGVIVKGWAVFLLGFLGGHVFWGTAGPGSSWCDTDRLDLRVEPHERLAAPAATPESAIVFRVSVTGRQGQEDVGDFEVDISDLVDALGVGPGEIQRFTSDDVPEVFQQVVVITPSTPLAEGEYSGGISVTEVNHDADDPGRTCELRSPYIVEVGG